MNRTREKNYHFYNSTFDMQKIYIAIRFFSLNKIMGHIKSKLAEHTSNKVSTSDKASRGERRNIKTIENALLIWLDANINVDDVDCQNTIMDLQQVIHTVKTFMNSDDCIQFLENVRDKEIFMITSGSLGKVIMPRVHHMSQVDSIFIFCRNKQYHETWANNWRKVIGVYTDIQSVCDALQQFAIDCEPNPISFGLVTPCDNVSNDLNRLDPMFMYTQIIKEILLSINFESKHLEDFARYGRDTPEVTGNNQLGKVNSFQQDYRKKSAIWWYTLESFLYHMLNKALRQSDIDIIIRIGFFIHDLHREIENLHRVQFTSANNKRKQFIVYRGQGMCKEELDRISKNMNGLLSFTHFLSTSKNEKIAMKFAKRSLKLKNSDIFGILFVMTIDPQQSTIPFASIANASAYKNNEEEILFAMHTIFRIRNIKPIDGYERLIRIELELTSDNDNELQILTTRIRQETFPNSPGWDRLGLVLLRLDKAQQAEEVYNIILQQETDESKNGWLFQRLGRCKAGQNQSTQAIQFYEKSIEIYEKYSPNDSSLPKSYGNIGNVYFNMKQYVKALSYYEKALTIKQKSLPSEHLDLAYTYNSIGNVHTKMGNYDKALESYKKALSIRETSLPPNHPSLAATHVNLGVTYENMRYYLLAYSYYEKAVKIEEKSLPPNHSNLQDSREKLEKIKKQIMISSRKEDYATEKIVF